MKIKFKGKKIDLKPTKIIAAAKNYEKHIKEMKSEIPDEPKIFLKPPSSLLPDGGTIILPKSSNRVDHEVELGVIMKDKCHGIKPSEVKEYILGYCVFLDITARDIQQNDRKKGLPWSVAKGFDTFSPLGPHIVPADKIKPENLKIWLKVNGEIRQQSSTEYMIFSIEELISYSSTVMTLERMDIIATGTPEGVGPLEDGDNVEAGIEGIGKINLLVKAE